MTALLSIPQKLGRENLFNGPSLLGSFLKCRFLDSNENGPISETHCFSIERKRVIGSPISSLLLRSCPSAVAGFIVAVVIYSFNRVFAAWSRPHIIYECSERIPPAVADVYSSSPVAGIAWYFGIVAPANHSSPKVSNVRLGESVGVMLAASDIRRRDTTPTTSAFATERRAKYNSLGSAVAAAEPFCSSVSAVSRNRNYSPLSISLSSPVIAKTAKASNLGLSHDVAFRKKVLVVRAARC